MLLGMSVTSTGGGWGGLMASFRSVLYKIGVGGGITRIVGGCER